MPPKRTTAPGAALQPLDTYQETISLREARSQKRKATSPTLNEDEWYDNFHHGSFTFDDASPLAAEL
jgi:hypothetical protein